MPTVQRQVNTKAIKALEGIVLAGRYETKVGWFETAHYPGGVPVALVAAVQEFGWPEHNIPPRLGMRATAEAMRGKWAEISKSLSARVAQGKMTGEQAMDLIGQAAAGDVRKHIAEVRTPPLKVATVEARLRGKKQGNVVSVSISKPLVHTGHLLNTLTSRTDKV